MMINCRQASLLTELELHGELSQVGKFQLRLHQLLCSVCRSYARQVKRLREFFRGPQWQEQLPPLSDTARLRIQNEIQREVRGR